MEQSRTLYIEDKMLTITHKQPQILLKTHQTAKSDVLCDSPGLRWGVVQTERIKSVKYLK